MVEYKNTHKQSQNDSKNANIGIFFFSQRFHKAHIGRIQQLRSHAVEKAKKLPIEKYAQNGVEEENEMLLLFYIKIEDKIYIVSLN